MRTTRLSALCMVALLTISSTVSAAVLTATFDSWVRDDGATANDRDNDLVTVCSSTSLYGPLARYGILEFDLSSINVPITSAYLQLWNQPNGAGDDSRPADQTATLINPVGAGSSGVGLLDWTGINSAIGAGTSMTQLGNITAPPVITPKYVNTSASAADLVALNADRTGDQLATFVMVANELGTDVSNTWGDDNTMRAMLTINEPPVPSPLSLSGAIWARAGDSHTHDGVIVVSDPAVLSGTPTVGLMEWDLSDPGIGDPAQLIGAKLTLQVAHSGYSQHPGQVAALIHTAGGTPLAGITDEPSYESEYGGAEQALETLAYVPAGSAPLNAGDSVVTLASTGDLQLIRDVMSGAYGDNLLTIAMHGIGNDSSQYWGDGPGGYGGAPVLELMFAAVPEPSSVLLIALGVTCLNLTGLRRR